MKTQFTLIILFTTFLLVLVTISAFAQPTPSLPGTNPSAVPIDGGLALLAVAGGGYAIKKLRDRKE